MFIGHFAVAYLLIALFPAVPPLVILTGVSFPDLLWPVLVLTGKETVTVSPDSPLQNAIRFTSYPYSHSLVTGSLIAAIPGLFIAYFVSPAAGILFVAASASHWMLDVVTHLKDLPVLGFGKDMRVGFGLWNHAKAAFVLELAFYTVIRSSWFNRHWSFPCWPLAVHSTSSTRIHSLASAGKIPLLPGAMPFLRSSGFLHSSGERTGSSRHGD